MMDQHQEALKHAEHALEIVAKVSLLINVMLKQEQHSCTSNLETGTMVTFAAPQIPKN